MTTNYASIADTLEALPDLIRAEQLRRGIALRQVARETDLSVSLVWDYINLRRSPGLKTATTLLRWLDGRHQADE